MVDMRAAVTVERLVDWKAVDWVEVKAALMVQNSADLTAAAKVVNWVEGWADKWVVTLAVTTAVKLADH